MPAARAELPPALLAGRVVDATGTPLGDASVSIVQPAGGFAQTTRTGPDGGFALRIAAGDYVIVVRSAGFAAERRSLSVPASGARIEFVLQPGGLTEVVEVVGTRLAGTVDAARLVPGSFDVLDSRTLELSRPFTFGEALRKIPGVHVREEEGFGLRPSIGLRGLDPNRSAKVLLLEDGVPLGHAPYGDTDAYYHPPVERYEAVEVLKGSGQIAYGPMTIGGVLNYITPAPPDRFRATATLTGGNRDYLNGRGNLGFRAGRLGVLIDGMRKQGDGAREHISSTLHDVNAKTVVGTGHGRTLTVKAGYYREDSNVTYSGLTTSEYQANPRANPFRNDWFHGRRAGASGAYAAALNDRTLFTATSYASWFSRDWWRQSSNSDQRPNDAGDPACGGMANLDRTCGNEGRLRDYVAWGVDPRIRVSSRLFGFEQETDVGLRIHGEAQDRLQKNGSLPTSREGTIVEDNERSNFAVSAHVQQRLVFGRWAVTPGLRVERVAIARTNRLLDAGAGSGDTTVTQLIPGIGVSFGPTGRTTLFGGVHRGFAPPRPADIISNTGGVLELEPELSWNYEVGARTLAARGLRLAATAFRLDYENQIVPASLSGGVGSVLTSAGRTLHQGIESSARFDTGDALDWPHNVYVRLAYSYIGVAEFRGVRFSSVAGFSGTPVTGNRLPYSPRHLLTGAWGYSHPAGVDVELEAVHVGNQFSDDLNTVVPTPNGQRGLVPAATTWNASVNVAFGRHPRATLFVTTKNLLDATPIVDRRRGVMVGMPRLVQVGSTLRF